MLIAESYRPDGAITHPSHRTLKIDQGVDEGNALLDFYSSCPPKSARLYP